MELTCKLCGKPKKRQRGDVCAACSKINYREKNRAKLAAKSREIYAQDPGKQNRRVVKWSQANPELRAKSNERHADYYRKKSLERTKRLPWTIAAQHAINNAITSGKVVRQPCQICNKPKAEAHHDSYLSDQYLNVKWFCREHHKAWHRLFLPEIPTTPTTKE